MALQGKRGQGERVSRSISPTLVFPMCVHFPLIHLLLNFQYPGGFFKE